MKGTYTPSNLSSLPVTRLHYCKTVATRYAVYKSSYIKDQKVYLAVYTYIERMHVTSSNSKIQK